MDSSVREYREGRNGGKLLTGGVPGHKGGGGRPSSELRARSRVAFALGLDFAERLLAGDVEGSTADKLRAMDITGKYGLGEATVLLPEEMLGAMAEAFDELNFSGEQIEVVFEVLKRRLCG
ncbi:MAG TPA: hypothetical protein VK934_00910 [Fimbriimonas sp.]|nr:hypothetical protein [Fimbriimonas sp.]